MKRLVAEGLGMGLLTSEGLGMGLLTSEGLGMRLLTSEGLGMRLLTSGSRQCLFFPARVWRRALLFSQDSSPASTTVHINSINLNSMRENKGVAPGLSSVWLFDCLLQAIKTYKKWEGLGMRERDK